MTIMPLLKSYICQSYLVLQKKKKQVSKLGKLSDKNSATEINPDLK